MLAVWLLLCACQAPFSAARAENGRDFAGEYNLSGIVESNGTVNAILTVRIVNYSGHDILGARLLLTGSQTVIADNIGFANHGQQVIRTLSWFRHVNSSDGGPARRSPSSGAKSTVQ
jgi:hypothetical protein